MDECEYKLSKIRAGTVSVRLRLSLLGCTFKILRPMVSTSKEKEG